MYYVFVLKYNAREFEIGYTDDIDVLTSHKNRPAYFTFSNRETAQNFERYLRSASGLAFMQAHSFTDLYFLANALEFARHFIDRHNYK